MNALTDALNTVIRKAQPVRNPGDYIQDGLLYCGACRTPKQCRVRFELPCGWWAVNAAALRAEAERKAEQQRREMDRRAAAGVLHRGPRRAGLYLRIGGGNAGSSALQSAQHLSGRCGRTRGCCCGATPAPARPCGGLHRQRGAGSGIPAMVTSFPKILGVGWDARDKIISQLNRYKLLVLDDLGAERR
ncbi:MAG: hypothetical protein ACLVDB_03475 [Anaeromassilibacillus sp.]